MGWAREKVALKMTFLINWFNILLSELGEESSVTCIDYNYYGQTGGVDH